MASKGGVIGIGSSGEEKIGVKRASGSEKIKASASAEKHVEENQSARKLAASKIGGGIRPQASAIMKNIASSTSTNIGIALPRK